MLFVFPQGGGKVIQRNAFKILVFGRTILRDKQVGVINGTAGIGIFDLHMVGSRCRKVSFDPDNYLTDALLMYTEAIDKNTKKDDSQDKETTILDNEE